MFLRNKYDGWWGVIMWNTDTIPGVVILWNAMSIPGVEHSCRRQLSKEVCIRMGVTGFYEIKYNTFRLMC
jgi:hypothetical protein